MYSMTMLMDKEKSRTTYAKMVFFGMVLVIPTFLSGFNNSYPAVALPQMDLDIHDASWFASVLLYASTISVIIVGCLIDRCGRKVALLYTIVPSSCGWLLLYSNYSVPTILLGQALNGLSCGAGYYPVQVYAGECFMADNVRTRNVFMAWTSLSTSIGAASMLVLGNVFDYHQICLISSVMCVIMLVIFHIFIPESPTWLYRQGRIGDAEWSQKIRGLAEPILRSHHQNHSTQQRVIPTAAVTRQTLVRHKLQLISRPDIYKPTIILSCAAILLSMCGTMTVISYMIDVIDNTIPGVDNQPSKNIHQRVPTFVNGSIAAATAGPVTGATTATTGATTATAGVTTAINTTATAATTAAATAVTTAGTASVAAAVVSIHDVQLETSYRLSLYSGIFMCVGSLVSVCVLPKMGLKNMLIASRIVIMLAFVAVTYGSVVQPVSNILVRVIGVTVISFSIGFEIGPRLSYVGDIFPVDAKGFASVPALISCLSKATENKFFPYLRFAFGGYVYFIFSGICFLCVVYIHYYVPEVVGRTLEDINNEYTDKDNTNKNVNT